jgi:hypothetical protein
MGKTQKKEDNRDVFEKALDNAPALGAIGGAVLGGAAMKKFGKKLSSSKLQRADSIALSGLVGLNSGYWGGSLARHLLGMDDPAFKDKKRRK